MAREEKRGCLHAQCSHHVSGLFIKVELHNFPESSLIGPGQGEEGGLADEGFQGLCQAVPALVPDAKPWMVSSLACAEWLGCLGARVWMGGMGTYRVLCSHKASIRYPSEQ